VVVNAVLRGFMVAISVGAFRASVAVAPGTVTVVPGNAMTQGCPGYGIAVNRTVQTCCCLS